MSIDYGYNVGYGFLLPENKYARPAQWEDDELWYDGIIDKEISGSGLTAILGGDTMCGNRLWGFVAQDTYTRMSKYDEALAIEIRDVDPIVFSNIFDMRARVKRPGARIGWVMWMDIS